MSASSMYKLAVVCGTAGLVLLLLGLTMDDGGARRGTGQDLSDRGYVEPGADAPATTTGSSPSRHVDISRLDPVMDEETAKSKFAGLRSGKRQRYHPLAMTLLKPGLDLSYPWPEHEGGRVLVRTNNLGLRRDEDTAVAKTSPRVLFVGDSHTEGLVDNDETFVMLAERALEQARGSDVECLNAGVGGTGPHNYLGTIRAWLHLQPDVVVAMLYLGNDFTDAVFLGDHFTGRKPQGLTWETYGAPLDAAMKRWNTSLVGNSFNEAYRFKARPEEEWLALAEVAAVFGEMAALCEREGVAFLVGIVPAKPQVDDDDRRTEDEILAALGMARDDLAVIDRLHKGIAGALRTKGIAVVDPTAVMRASPTPYYWLKDHHLNVEGNALLAGQLVERLVPLLPP